LLETGVASALIETFGERLRTLADSVHASLQLAAGMSIIALVFLLAQLLLLVEERMWIA
jgi:hypothetical protein